MIPMHIGLIGGIGPAATEFYYRHLTRAHARADRALELTIVHAQVRDLARHFAGGAMTSRPPIHGRSASGTTTLPSAC